MKILIIRLSAIGDVIHCLPMASAIKKRFPNAELSWLVDPMSASLIKNNPCVDKVIVSPVKDWNFGDPKNWGQLRSQMVAFLKEYRGRHYDIVLETQGLLKSAVLGVASGAPIRIGFKGTREFAELLLTDPVDVGDYFGHDKPVVELNLMLVDYLCKKFGVPGGTANLPVEFPLPTISIEVEQKIEKELAQLNVSPNTPSTPAVTPKNSGGVLDIGFAVLIPGTTWSSKTWPTKNWLELAKMLATDQQLPIVLVGGSSEQSTNGDIFRGFQIACPDHPILDLTNKTSLLDLIELFRRSNLVVGGDTGPLHLAAATGIPSVIGVYGSTPRHRLGPYGTKCHTVALDLDCQPCYAKKCPLGTIARLNDLSPERVHSEIQSFIKDAIRLL